MRISLSHGSTDATLTSQTIGEAVRQAAAQHPDRLALVSRHQCVRLTFRELDEAVSDVAAGLLSLGLSHGERIGLWSPNRAEWTLVQYGSARAGLVLVNLNPAYRQQELAYALAQSGCAAVIAPQAFRTSAYQEMLQAARPALPALRHVVHFDTDGWDDLLRAGRAALLAGSAQPGGALHDAQAATRPGDVINIQYTSGTTGSPKGASLTHDNILNNGRLTGEALAYGPADRVCLPVPLYHCFGMVIGNLAALAHGAAVVLPAPVFEPTATLQAVQAEGCTSLYGVPSMFIALLDEQARDHYDVSTLRTGVMGGSPCPPEVMRRTRTELHLRDMTIAYGMTETSPVATQTEPGDDENKTSTTVGRAAPHVQIKVCDPDGTAVPVGTVGEICIRGYNVMRGYWQDPEQTAESVDGDGWMHTGDLGVMDDDGYVSVAGRVKDMIIRGGENIYPREIEDLLYTHPGIAEAQVVGVPDDFWGEEVCAWIRLAPGAVLDAEAVRQFCRERLSHYKVPNHVRTVDGFPTTVTGKTQKFVMRDQTVAWLAQAR